MPEVACWLLARDLPPRWPAGERLHTVMNRPSVVHGPLEKVIDAMVDRGAWWRFSPTYRCDTPAECHVSLVADLTNDDPGGTPDLPKGGPVPYWLTTLCVAM